MNVTIEIEEDMPSSTWVGNTWISGERTYSVKEMKTLFADECTLFVGDSLQRRAGDTLFLMLGNKDAYDIPNDIFADRYFNAKHKDRGRNERPVPGARSNTSCLDFEWRPTLADLANFTTEFVAKPETYAKYTLVIAGAGVWDSCKQFRLSPTVVARRTNETVNAMQDLSEKVSVIWKTNGLSHAVDATNDKIKGGNEQAISRIKEIQKEHPSSANQLTYLDWGKHVQARSLGDKRILSGDNNPYHFGLEPRLVLLHMLSTELDNRKPHLLHKNDAQENLTLVASASDDSVVRAKSPCNTNGEVLLVMGHRKLLQSSVLLLVILLFFRRRRSRS
jgi:hypothetical protein